MKKLTEFTIRDVEQYLMSVLGDDPVEGRQQRYLDALYGIGVDGVQKIILSILGSAIRPEMVSSSYFHPNKFFKLGISRLPNKVKLRLHFWHKNHLEAKTPIHFHAWEYASLLVAGSYVHDLFRVREPDEAAIAWIQEYRKSQNISDARFVPEQYFGMYKIPKRDAETGKFRPELTKYVSAEKISSKVEVQGSAYFLGMEFPHQITIPLKEVGSVITLVLTSETDLKRMFTFQPITQFEVFDNPSPNADAQAVVSQLEMVLEEMRNSCVFQ